LQIDIAAAAYSVLGLPFAPHAAILSLMVIAVILGSPRI
jgi:hypothetical protein